MRYFSHILVLLCFVLSGLPVQAQTKEDSLKQLFRDAQTELQAMLEGKAPMNFSRAVYLHENAYLGGTLSYEAFMNAIRFRAEIAKRIAHTKPTQGYKKADSLQVQLQASIFKLLTDTTQVEFGGGTGEQRSKGAILPARYAWEDFAGQKNWEVMFVSRLLQTNEGNCHSLPYLYKLIADELRVPAWLSCAPHHLYIQGYSQQTGLFNTELSSASFPKDSWLMASGYVGKDAVRNRVYMDTLTLKQSIALCMVDLAQGYQRKFQDKDFALACLQTAQKAYPQGLSAYLAEIQTQTAIFQSTKQWANYHRLEALAKKVCELGYQEIPRAEYVRWLANPHQAKNNTESKFSTNPLPTFEVNTLSNGKYAETSDLVKPRRIGSLLYSTKQGKILQFVAPDTVAVPVEVSARFLSVDPLTKGYPMLTPYQFASNTPILCIDLDGLERMFPTSYNGYEVKLASQSRAPYSINIKAGGGNLDRTETHHTRHHYFVATLTYETSKGNLVQAEHSMEIFTDEFGDDSSITFPTTLSNCFGHALGTGGSMSDLSAKAILDDNYKVVSEAEALATDGAVGAFINSEGTLNHAFLINVEENNTTITEVWEGENDGKAKSYTKDKYFASGQPQGKGTDNVKYYSPKQASRTPIAPSPQNLLLSIAKKQLTSPTEHPAVAPPSSWEKIRKQRIRDLINTGKDSSFEHIKQKMEPNKKYTESQKKWLKIKPINRTKKIGN